MTFIAEKSPTKLNELQISLLRMFERDIPEKDLVEIRDLISDYLAEKVLKNVDEVVAKKNLTQIDYDKLEDRPYRKKND